MTAVDASFLHRRSSSTPSEGAPSLVLESLWSENLEDLARGSQLWCLLAFEAEEPTRFSIDMTALTRPVREFIAGVTSIVFGPGRQIPLDDR